MLESGSGHASGDQDEWISVSDLMTGLMVIFLFVAIAFIRPVSEENREMREIARAWEDREKEIRRALEAEFKDDWSKWNAEIDDIELVIRFKSPEVLFEVQKSELRDEFRNILDDFFPRYVEVLLEHRHAIDEIRIEGHTSSEWEGEAVEKRRYINNMQLSQERTLEVLKYVLLLNVGTADIENWLRKQLTASGLSSSHPIEKDGKEDKRRSRRVEFRVRTNAGSEIQKILEAAR